MVNQKTEDLRTENPEAISFEPSSENRFALRGTLSFETVAEVWPACERLLKAAPQDTLQIELSGVTRSDSSGLALLLGCLRVARAQGKPLQFKNLPPSLRALVRLAGLAELLAIAPHG